MIDIENNRTERRINISLSISSIIWIGVYIFNPGWYSSALKAIATIVVPAVIICTAMEIYLWAKERREANKKEEIL